MVADTYLRFLVGVCGLINVQGVNWAQVSGPQRTNIATVHPTGWKSRWGHAAVAVELTAEEVTFTQQNSSIYIIGGDNQHWAATKTHLEVEAYPGGEGYTNDVWSSTGVEYFTTLNLLESTDWGDPMPRMVSVNRWIQKSKGKVPPGTVTYNDWIACSLLPFGVQINNNTEACADTTQPPGSYLADNMFSPRRYHAAVAIRHQIYVMGGRAREMEYFRDEDSYGGILAPDQTRRARERSVLKNDVWLSSTGGDRWVLIRPGCRFPDAALISPGTRSGICFATSQCFGDEVCVLPEKGGPGFCACGDRIWSPREQHSVAVFNGKIYVAGGYTFVYKQICGGESATSGRGVPRYRCGGQHPHYLNDVWSSPNGALWTKEVERADWAPRALHGMAAFQNNLYIMAGFQGGSKGDCQPNRSVIKFSFVPVDEPDSYFNDVWRSSDGVTWTRMTEPAWGPRSDFKALAVAKGSSTELLVMGGTTGDHLLNDVWSWSGVEKDPWLLDYGPASSSREYVAANSQMSILVKLRSGEAKKLASQNLTTVGELATANRSAVLPIRNRTRVCDYKMLAMSMMDKCTIKPILPDGYEYKNLQIVDGGMPPAPSQADLDKEAIRNWDGCQQILTKIISLQGTMVWPKVNGVEQMEKLEDPIPATKEKICKWEISPRKGFAAAVYNGSAWVLGGFAGDQSYLNDVWYRDNRHPVTTIPVKPDTLTYDLHFEFACDKPICLYEYQVLDSIEMVMLRNWTPSIGKEDLTWLPSGTHTISVRAFDPAGNYDTSLELGRNVYTWVYVPKLPWTYIALGIVGFIILLIAIFLEWRRRRRKRAMERYAMKRMRRKLKAEQRKGKGGKPEDWKKAYNDAKDKDGKKKKKKKKDAQKGGSKIAPGDALESPQKKKKAEGKKDK